MAALRFMWCMFCGRSPQNMHHMNLSERRRRELADNSQALNFTRAGIDKSFPRSVCLTQKARCSFKFWLSQFKEVQTYERAHIH